MASAKRFERSEGTRSYRKLFLLSVEGTKTEPQYFYLLRDLAGSTSTLQVECLKTKTGSDPTHVLKRMKTRLSKAGIKPTDEAWLVVDKDQWTDAQLTELNHWCHTAENYQLALSNPCFEYWLLLHFEDQGISNRDRCLEHLRQYLPNYDKAIPNSALSLDQIQQAVARAQKRDQPPCADWPRSPGATTVYRLVKNILTTR